MRTRDYRIATTFLLTVTALLAGAGLGCEAEPDDGPATTTGALEVVCLPPDTTPPQDAWVCGEERVEECDRETGSHPASLWVTAPVEDGQPLPACVDGTLVLSDDGPFGPGTHTISVTFDGALVCESRLTVVDTAPPQVTPREVALWPPNHKQHTIGAGDCLDVVDRCDEDVEVVFTWATSDEPDDDGGDGSTTGDIAVAPAAVTLRAERMGGGDGRVYRLGWVAVDDEGNSVDGVCTVAVPHDQGNGSDAADSGAAALVVLDSPAFAGPYRVLVDGTDGTPDVVLEPVEP